MKDLHYGAVFKFVGERGDGDGRLAMLTIPNRSRWTTSKDAWHAIFLDPDTDGEQVNLLPAERWWEQVDE